MRVLCRAATIICAFLYASSVSGGEVSFDFEKCHYGDNECFKKVTTHILQNYGPTGIRSVNLLPFDPLHVKSLILEQNPNSPVNVALSFKDVDIGGLKNAQVLKVTGFERDIKDHFIIEGIIPESTINGAYAVKGSVLVLPITGKGIANISMKKLHLKAKVLVKPVKKGSDTYLSVEDVILDMGLPNSVAFTLTGLFDGNKNLADTTNAFLNENWREIFGELKPGFSKAFALILKSICKSVFDKHPYNDYFLEE